MSAFFSIPIGRGPDTVHIYVRWSEVYSYGLVSVYINTLTLCVIILLVGIMLAHYIDSAMLIRPDEQEIAGMLEALANQMCAGGWGLKPQNPSALMNYLGIQKFGSEESETILSKLNNKILYLPLLREHKC